MKLTIQKRIAADILKCSPSRVKFDTERLDEIKESITKADIRGLINDGIIKKIQEKGVSRVRAKKTATQRRKGRKKGYGSRKGKQGARLPSKERWMNSIRLQRKFLKELRDAGMITKKSYSDLYNKAKGGFFRSKSHLKLFIGEHKLIIKNEKQS